jgi:DNA-directed RNA polymerase sigma subunit (sigma70/sigma32)
MTQLSTSNRLTLEVLKREVPIFQTGRAAEAELRTSPKMGERRRKELVRQAQLGREAQDRLVAAGIPLVKTLAQKEWRRRQKWQSQIPFDDLVQEGMIGFIRGLSAFNLDVPMKSPTNYLGQWIQTEMRRNSEALDNDFEVAFDAAERFRRIRAVRARLSSELGREPTDAEMMAASEQTGQGNDPKLGRLNKDPRRTPKRFTQAQLDEERDFRTRVGSSTRLGAPRFTTEDSAASDLSDMARPLAGELMEDASHQALLDAQDDGLALVISHTMTLMNLPGDQRELISRRYGLSPHATEQSIRDISRAMSLHRETVSGVLEAFTSEMTRIGGAFHRVCAQMDEATLADLGLSWTVSALGAAPATWLEDVPAALTDPLPKKRRTASAPPPPPPSVKAFLAQFLCEFHNRSFNGYYQKSVDVPDERDCPWCGRPAARLHTVETK